MSSEVLWDCLVRSFSWQMSSQVLWDCFVR